MVGFVDIGMPLHADLGIKDYTEDHPHRSSSRRRHETTCTGGIRRRASRNSNVICQRSSQDFELSTFVICRGRPRGYHSTGTVSTINIRIDAF